MKIEYEDSKDLVDNNKTELFDNEDLFDDMGMGDFGEGTITPMEKHSQLLKELTDFAPFLREMFAEWIGVTWDPKTEKFKKDSSADQTMTLKGARWSISFLRTYARKTNIITRLDKDTYDHILEDIEKTLILNIGTRDEFGIKNNGDFLLVSNQLIHAAQLVLVGAGGKDNYKDLLSKTVHVSESLSGKQDFEGTKQKDDFLERARRKLGF